MYADGAATQRVAHQPNFMPALNIVAQAALCDEMSKDFAEDTCQVLVLVDYDVNTDRRYRHSPFPVISAPSGFRSLSVPALHHDHEALMFREPVPPPTFVADVLRLVNVLARQDLGAIRRSVNDHSTSRHALGNNEATYSEHFKEARRTLPPYLARTPRIVNVTIPQDDWSLLGEMAVPDQN